jgi:hypothetical protein
LDWKKKLEFVFDYQGIKKKKNVKLVVIVFTDYTISWWDQLVKSRRHKREMPIEVWK